MEPVSDDNKIIWECYSKFPVNSQEDINPYVVNIYHFYYVYRLITISDFECNKDAKKVKSVIRSSI